MEFTAKLIAEYLNGEVVGDENTKVTKPARIEDGKPGSLCFLANPKYEKHIYTTKASIILINKDFKLENPVNATLVKVDDAYQGIATMLDLFSKNKRKYKGRKWGSKVAFSAKLGKGVYVGTQSCVAKKAKIGNNVKIYPQVYVGENVEIGDNTILYPGVKIYADCKVGENCIIHSGTVIGSDGFGFAPDENNIYKKIPQLGNVIIEDNVEIGANCAIDRATMGSTIIRNGSKLDNLIQVAHNVEIGENTVLASQVGIAGSAKIGKNCMLGGQAGISGHISIANNTKIAAQAGISNTIKKENTILFGSPAQDIGKERRAIAAYRNGPDIMMKIRQLEKEIEKLKNN